MNNVPVYVADRDALFVDLEHFISAHLDSGKNSPYYLLILIIFVR